MPNRERRKGLAGEREVAAIFEDAGLEVRGLESAGDHLVICGGEGGFTLHSEVKRQETARPWQWWAQATSEAPPGTIPLVTFRRSRSGWLSMLAAGDLALILRYAVYGAECRVRDLERQATETLPLLRPADEHASSLPELPRARGGRPARLDHGEADH